MGGAAVLTASPSGVSADEIVKSRTPWTAEEVRLLEDLANRNTSLQVIALKLGRSAAAVESKAAQLKIEIRRTKRRYTRKSSSRG